MASESERKQGVEEPRSRRGNNGPESPGITAARQRLRIELWSWSTWLILGIISYPALLLISIAPRAGLLAGLLAGLSVVYVANLGYSGHRELGSALVGLAATALSCGAALLVGAMALVGDNATSQTALLCALIVLAEIVFAWHFLPWLVRDADSPEGVPSGFPIVGRVSHAPVVRPALGLVLFLALLTLGLGSAWSRGEAQVPNPTVWIIALVVLCLAVMFVERMTFLEQAAREGNLLMAPRSYRTWLGTAMAVLLSAAALATAFPFRGAKEATETPRIGSAPAASAAQSAGQRLSDEAARLAGAVSNTAAGIGGTAREMPSLLLLFLLLVLLLALAWAFRRSRAARWLVRVSMTVVTALVRMWRRMMELLGRRQAPAPQREAIRQQTDLLFDLFAEPDGLTGLSAREVAIRAYHLLLNFAEMLGHGRRRGQTPFEYAAALESAAPTAAGSVRALTWAYSGAMYGGEAAEFPDPCSMRDSWQRISAALISGMSEEELALRRRAYLSAMQA